jgi:hypothetical protein
MQTRLFSLVFGVVYTLVGLVGFVPAFRTHPAANAPHVDVTAAYGYLFGLFPVNAVHDIFHIVVGIIGIVAFTRLGLATAYCRLLFLVFGLLVVAGFMPQANTLWGVLPLFDSDTWLHAATAIAAGYFGFVASEPTYVEPAPGHVIPA